MTITVTRTVTGRTLRLGDNAAVAARQADRAEAAAQSIDDRVQILTMPGGGWAFVDENGDAAMALGLDGVLSNKTIAGMQSQIDTLVGGGAGQATFDKSDIVEANADASYLAVGKYLLINAYGQSLSTGTLASAALSTTAIAGVKMFTGGPRDRDGGFSSASVVDHVEHVTGTAGETILAGMAQAIRHLLLVEDGIDISASHTLLMNTSGEPGQSALALAPGSTPHNRLEAAITDAKARAGATAFDVLALPFLQGEQDYTDGTAPATWATRVEAIRADTQAHVQTTTGLTRGLPMVIYQMAQHIAKATDPDLALKAVDMCSENAAIGFACPMHFLDYVDTAHLTARSYLWAGLYFGLAVKRWCFDGYKPMPLTPSAAVWDATGVTLTFPTTGKLVFDTEQVSDPGNFGFSLETGDGVTQYPVEVYILGRNKVRVQRAAGVAVPVGAACRYAFYTDDPGAGATLTGRLTGARGCLRDNRGEVIAIPTTAGETFPLHQWAAIFEEIKP